ncbi:MAG TPA: shikimate dehydrogenase [Bacteroidetes bacterium]|nr:shikimate dehydrogenase [Bacteroidota bacterium]
MRHFGIIGYPLGHSFSPAYFNEKFKKEDIKDAIYEAFPLKSIGKLQELLKDHPNIRGLNVTVPYKEKVIPYLDVLDPFADVLGAVNTIKVKDDRLIGFNTDVGGFIKAIQPKLKPHHKSALILGSGGSAKAVKAGLDVLGMYFKVVSRSEDKGDILYKDLNASIIGDHELIINTTPLGMFPEIKTYPDIPYAELRSKHLCFDLVYNPGVTEFLKKSSAMGAECYNGYEMLKAQAELSWKLWNA